MARKNQSGQKTVFRRIGGRIVPIQVQREASAVTGTMGEVSRKPQVAASIAKAVGYTAAGFGLAFGAGKLKKLSELALKTPGKAKMGEVLERTAKFTDFGGKAGMGMLAGHEITKADRMTKSDEKSRLMNVGAQGVGPLAIGLGLVGGFAAYRVGKRFQKWGYYGGKFPMKLRDL